MSFSQRMKNKAKSLQKSLLLPEGHEPRTLAAARKITDLQLASSVTLLGNIEEIRSVAEKESIPTKDLILIDPAGSVKREQFATEYYNLRKHKGMTLEKARADIADVLRWGAMMIRRDECDAMVAGAENSTGDVLRAAFTIIKTAPGVSSASSCFVINCKEDHWGTDGNLIFSDCAIIPEPTAEQLAEIAIAAAGSCRTFLQAEPIIALLSYSTKGSASGKSVEKVAKALSIVKSKAPELNVDGELQLDAALIPEIGKRKAPRSSVAGRANVLVFPDLSAGNIGYKLVQRLARANAFGPFLQGFAKPLSDLSRGCSSEDIVVTSAATLVRAEYS
jgi:phosphate acetyltransferase